jgi:hypothetical protein
LLLGLVSVVIVVICTVLVTVPTKPASRVTVNTNWPVAYAARVGVTQVNVTGGPGSSVGPVQPEGWVTTPPYVTSPGKVSTRMTSWASDGPLLVYTSV